MKFLQRLRTVLKTLNPDSYENLCKEFSILEAWKQFFFNYAFFFAVLMLIFVPAVLLGANGLQSRLQSFSSFTLDANVSATDPVTLLTSPDIVVDLRENATTPASILFTKRGLQWRVLFGKYTKTWDEIKDLTKVNNNSLFLLLLFLVPSLAFWSALIFLFLFLFAVVIASILLFFVPRLWHFKLSYSTAIKLSLFASTIMMATGLLLIPFYRSWWLPLLSYLIFLSLGVALVGERKLSHEPKHPRSKNRRNEIWD